jgi:hypothetical protein
MARVHYGKVPNYPRKATTLDLSWLELPTLRGFWVSAVLYGLWQWEISRFLIIFLAIAGLQAFLERRK